MGQIHSTTKRSKEEGSKGRKDEKKEINESKMKGQGKVGKDGKKKWKEGRSKVGKIQQRKEKYRKEGKMKGKDKMEGRNLSMIQYHLIVQLLIFFFLFCFSSWMRW